MPTSSADEVGDEPLLLRRRTGVPVVVGADRAAASRALLAAHPAIDLLIADDGLQHHGLARDAEIWLFDERGVGNGRLLPAGPLRQPLPLRLPPRVAVLYNAPAPTTPLPGAVLTRRLAGAVPLADWLAGAPMQRQTLEGLRGRRLVAVAGIASPERFFGMLRSEGLTLEPLPLPDHDPLRTLPWPAGTAEVVCTEKDAVKLDPARCGDTRVWVVGLDLSLPPDLATLLRSWIAPPGTPP